MDRFDRGSVVRFFHVDAIDFPKPNRPGIVGMAYQGYLAVYYGSTFKRGGAPRDAIVADPSDSGAASEKDLARCLGIAIDERTHFHGAMTSEVASSSPQLVRIPGKCPNDVLDTLEEQGQQQRLAFLEAWKRASWLQPDVRVGLLSALWWKAKLGLREELALNLLLCEGWALTEISALRRSEIDSTGAWRGSGGECRRLLPRTRLLVERWRADLGPTLGFADIARELEPSWDVLRNTLEKPQKKACPTWERCRQRVPLLRAPLDGLPTLDTKL